MKSPVAFVYILTNQYNNVLYTGVTNNLERRYREHKNKLVKGFTQKYNVDKLVYFEVFDSILDAIAREKQIKGYLKIRKVELVTALNPEWIELTPPVIF
jgi:putative endonuclease